MRHEHPRDEVVVTLDEIVTADGRTLAATLYSPVSAPVAQVIVHGATAVPRRYYDAFARWLASAGYRVMTYDYRGVGGSVLPDLRQDAATMTDWIRLDAPAAVNALAARDPELALLAIGHSFGGQVAAALPSAPAPIAIATMGAQRGYWATFPALVRPRMWLNWFVLMPLVTRAYGYLPAFAGLGTDMPSGVVLEWARWCKNPRYFLDDHPDLGARMAAFGGDLFAMSVTDDAFAPLANVEWLIDHHGSASTEHLRFEPRDAGVDAFGHFGFFRDRHRESVWAEVLGFFEQSLGRGERPAQLGTTTRPVRRALVRAPIAETDVAADLHYGRV
jgi:predicted alpha/beta hydrolase